MRALPEPDFTVSQNRKAILAFQRDVAGPAGYTSVFVPAAGHASENYLIALQQLDREGKLTVRYEIGLYANEQLGVDQVADFVRLREKYSSPLVIINTVKFFADGLTAQGPWSGLGPAGLERDGRRR